MECCFNYRGVCKILTIKDCSNLLKELERVGIKAFTPSENRKIRCRGKWHTQNVLIFSGYVFIDIEKYSPELFHKIRKLIGFIRFLGSPSPLSMTETEQIKWFCNNGKPIETSHYRLEDGKAKFIDGAVFKLQHLITSFCLRQHRVKLRLNVNGKSFNVSLPVEKI